MSKNAATKGKPAWLSPVTDILLCFALAFLGWYIYFATGLEAQEVAGKAAVYKYIMVAAGLGMVALLWFGELERLRNLPSLLLIGYAAFSAISVFWAVSGRLFIQRYSVVFTAIFFFLYAVLRGCGNPGFIRRAMKICAGISTIYAVLGVEAASTGIFRKILDTLLSESKNNMSFGVHLNAIFGNANVEASFYALGILLSVALICDAEDRKPRALWAAALACNAYAMALGLSLGAMTCLAVASVVYSITASEKRGGMLTRLISGTAFAFVFGLFAAKLYSSSSISMLLLLAVCVAVVVAWELLLGKKLVIFAQEKQRIIFAVVLGLIVLSIGYISIGLQLSAPVTFTESTTQVDRTITITPGKHTLQLDAETDTRIVVYSQDRVQLFTAQYTQLCDNYEERGKKIDFTVPENSAQCTIYLYGNPGETVNKATIDEKREIAFKYRILPDNIARRLASPLKTNSSVSQRLVYVKDGFKLFQLSPFAGLGAGAFESSVSRVQDYEYETVHSHNQYIEALLEGGVIGFGLFLGALATLGAALWRARKRLSEGEYAWLYPALCAEFVMSALQMFWDVSMSVTIFACMIYTLYGAIVSTCAEPLVLKKTDAEQTPVKKRKAAAKPSSDTGIRVACGVLPLLFVASVALNIHAQRLIRRPVETLDGFMVQLSRAERMDLYEKNDIRLSYVRAQMENDEDGTYYAQANEYARRLSTVPSNSIPYILTVYYLNTQQYGLAIEEAKAGARFSPSNSEVWNNIIDALKQIFVDSGENSPLLNDDGTLLRGLMEYYGMLQERDARSLKPIVLDANSAAFFDKLAQLSACGGDRNAMYAVLTA